MVRIKAFELFAVDLPFRKPFRHAAAERRTSSSILLQCMTDSRVHGFGESLPWEYVTGETRDTAFDLLARELLPHLIGRSFADLADLISFLKECNGKAPKEWVPPGISQTAAWAAVDLALLDAVRHAVHQPSRQRSEPGKQGLYPWGYALV